MAKRSPHPHWTEADARRVLAAWERTGERGEPLEAFARARATGAAPVVPMTGCRHPVAIAIHRCAQATSRTGAARRSAARAKRRVLARRRARRFWVRPTTRFLGPADHVGPGSPRESSHDACGPWRAWCCRAQSTPALDLRENITSWSRGRRAHPASSSGRRVRPAWGGSGCSSGSRCRAACR